MANLPVARGASRRHYKKDSRFILDLYTLTFDEHETVDALAMRNDIEAEETDTQTEAALSHSDAEGVMYYSLAHTKVLEICTYVEYKHKMLLPLPYLFEA